MTNKKFSQITRFYKIVDSWWILSGVIIGAVGTFIIFSPNIAAINNWYTQAIPQFHNMSIGLEQLTNFKIDPECDDYRQRDKSLAAGDVGFKEILNIVKSVAPQRLKKISVVSVTNRRDGTFRELSGEHIDVLNLIHVNTSKSDPHYLLITTESDLRTRIDLFRNNIIVGIGTGVVVFGMFWPYLWQLGVLINEWLWSSPNRKRKGKNN